MWEGAEGDNITHEGHVLVHGFPVPRTGTSSKHSIE